MGCGCGWWDMGIDFRVSVDHTCTKRSKVFWAQHLPTLASSLTIKRKPESGDNPILRVSHLFSSCLMVSGRVLISLHFLCTFTITFVVDGLISQWGSTMKSSCVCTVCLLLACGIVTVFQLYHGGDMMYEMRRRKPESTYTFTNSKDL